MMLLFLPLRLLWHLLAREQHYFVLSRGQYNRSDWLNVELTDLSGLIKDRKFSVSNWLLNSQLQEPLMGSCQLQGVDLGSFFSWRKWRYALLPFLFGPLSLRIGQNIRCSLWPKSSIRSTRDSLHWLLYTWLSNMIDMFLRNTQGSLSLAHYWKITMQRSCIKPSE